MEASPPIASRISAVWSFVCTCNFRRWRPGTRTRVMRSEYDFLLTFSQRLRRAAKISAVAGAVLAGAVSTALVIGVPLQLRSSIETTVSAATNSPAADPSQKPLKEAADAAVETTGGVKTALARLS